MQPTPHPGPLTLLWQDERYVAVHKPAGWLVHRTGLDAGATRFLLQTLRDQIGRPVWPVHRLDKGTSGVLVLALDRAAAAALAGRFEAREVSKRYLAMVRGWPPERAEVDHPLVPDDAPAGSAAQPAFTALRRLARLELTVPVDGYPATRAALVEACPLTGRRHQIRRHLKHLSHPVIGDATHGKGAHNRWWAAHLGMSRLWLHALELAFTHPFTGQALRLGSAAWPLAGPADAAADRGLAPDVTACLRADLNADWAALGRLLPWVLEG